MVTSTEDLRGSGPEVSSDTIGAAFMYNASGSSNLALRCQIYRMVS